MKHAYCTYFDHNYLSRALLMLRSLRAYDAESTVFVLALSDLCQAALKRLDLPKVEVIALYELEQAYPELLTVKLDRTPIEYNFTLTPVLPLYVFGLALSSASSMSTPISISFRRRSRCSTRQRKPRWRSRRTTSPR